jgi:hypothetical protein
MLPREMGTAWRYKLFKSGRMPPTLQAAAPGALLAIEGISLKVHGRSVKLPGLRSGRSVNLRVGALVLTQPRMLGSVGRYVLVDSALGPGEGPHRVSFSADGVRLTSDIATLFPQGSGMVEFHWDVELDQTVLSSLPSGSLSVALPEQVAALVRGCLG